MSECDYDDNKIVCGDADDTVTGNNSENDKRDETDQYVHSSDEDNFVCDDDCSTVLSSDLLNYFDEDYHINLEIICAPGIVMLYIFKSSATVDHVIRSVESRYHDDYDIKYYGRLLPQNMRLRDAYMPKICQVSTVERCIKITIKNAFNGRKYTARIVRSATVKHLKNKIRNSKKIKIADPRISFNGNELSDIKTLRDYDIQKNSELTVISRCYGG